MIKDRRCSRSDKNPGDKPVKHQDDWETWENVVGKRHPFTVTELSGTIQQSYVDCRSALDG